MAKIFFTTIAFLFLLSSPFALKVASAEEALSPEVSGTVDYLLQVTKSASKNIDINKVNPILSFSASLPKGDKEVENATYGDGIVIKTEIGASFDKMASYLFNPRLPNEVIYPQSIRRGSWMDGSDILKTAQPFVKSMGTAAAPLVLQGAEHEETTPDPNSGSYYVYKIKRSIIAFTDNGVKTIVSVSMQNGPSESGRKGFVLFNDSMWNYIYTNETGTTISGLGWAEPIMYDSLTIIIYSAKEGESRTSCTLFKWLNAGWGGINMVKRKHLVSGSERYFNGIKDVLQSSSMPSPSILIKERTRLESLTDAQRLQEFTTFAHYVANLSESKYTDSVFKETVKDNAYGANMSKNDLIAQMLKNYVRVAMGKADVQELPAARGKASNSDNAANSANSASSANSAAN